MSNNKFFIKNVSWGLVSYVYSVVIVIVTTPIIIKSIGIEAYGLWLLLQSLVGYYGFVDMGLRASLTQVLTRSIADQKFDEVISFIGSSVPIMFRLGLIVVALSTVIALVLPYFVLMSPDLSGKLWLILLIQALIVMINLVTQPFNGVTVGFQRYDIAEFLGILVRTLWAISIAVALSISGNILTFAIVSLSIALIDSFVRIQRAFFLLPLLRNLKLTIRKEDVRYLRGRGIWNFLIQVGRQILMMTNPLIVGVLFSATAVAPFALASSLIEYGAKLIYQPSRMLFPTLVHIKASERGKDLKLFFFESARLLTSISVGYGISAFIWCDIFFKVWLGESTQNASVFDDAPMIVAVLSVRFVLATFLETAVQLLLANEELRFLAIITLSEAIPSLFFAVLFGYIFGPVGVAAGSLGPMSVLFVFWYLPKILFCLDTNFLELLAKVFFPILCFSVVFFACIQYYSYYVCSPRTMAGFMFLCGLPSVVFHLILIPLLIDVRRFFPNFKLRRFWSFFK